MLQNLGLKRWSVYHYAVVIGVHPPGPDGVAFRHPEKGGDDGRPFQFHLAADPDHVAAANNLAEALVQSGQAGETRRVIHTAVTTAKNQLPPCGTCPADPEGDRAGPDGTKLGVFMARSLKIIMSLFW